MPKEKYSYILSLYVAYHSISTVFYYSIVLLEHGRKLTLARSLEKEAHDKDLQPSHGHHQQALNNAEVEDASLGAAHGTEIAVLARTEVFLVTGDCRQHSRHFHDRLLDNARLLGAGALFGWKLCFLLVFDLIWM
jgi:hypothetical protein